MTNKLLVLNMKMYMDIDDVKEYIKMVKDQDNMIISPESIYIPYFINKYKSIAIQNIYPSDSGAYTGCISARQVKKMGVNYTIVGHSECRKYFKLKDEDINLQIKSALANNLKVILCIGDDKNISDKLQFIKDQLTNDLKDILSNDIIIAYEPIYAIGTSAIKPIEIKKMVDFIKNQLRSMSLNLPVIYGGSVNSNNIKELNKIDNLSGFMVGRSSCVVSEVNEMKKVVSC